MKWVVIIDDRDSRSYYGSISCDEWSEVLDAIDRLRGEIDANVALSILDYYHFHGLPRPE